MLVKVRLQVAFTTPTARTGVTLATPATLVAFPTTAAQTVSTSPLTHRIISGLDLSLREPALLKLRVRPASITPMPVALRPYDLFSFFMSPPPHKLSIISIIFLEVKQHLSSVLEVNSQTQHVLFLTSGLADNCPIRNTLSKSLVHVTTS
jgi:hypothetical protein